MDHFTKITPEEYQKSPFQTIGKEWLLITAKKDGKVNTMTASWGGLGILWGRPVAYIFIRPQRYTKEFVDASSHFSLSVLGEEHRRALNYFGTVSGRDEDKIAKSGLKLCYQEDVPCFQDANTVFLCRKLYAQPLKPECFTDAADDAKWYPEKDYHTMYIAEIEGIYMK